MIIVKHRIQESCMLHVQVPLMLGILCGTLAYLSIFRVSDTLTQQLIDIEGGNRLEIKEKSIRNGIKVEESWKVEKNREEKEKISENGKVSEKRKELKENDQESMKISDVESEKNSDLGAKKGVDSESDGGSQKLDKKSEKIVDEAETSDDKSQRDLDKILPSKKSTENSFDDGKKSQKDRESNKKSKGFNKNSVGRKSTFSKISQKNSEVPEFSKSDPTSLCVYMKSKFKSEFPATVEFPMADDCDRWYGFGKEIRQCTIDYLTKIGDGTDLDAWNVLRRASACCSSGIYQMLSVTPLSKSGDTKFVVFPSSPNLPCYAVSIGLRKDLTTAKKLHEVMPQCEQYAAEDDRKLWKPFQDIGQVQPVSLNPHANRAKNQSTFSDFLHQIDVSEIDYLFVNAKNGVEFYILMWLLQQKQKENRIPICFVTVDMHGPPDKAGMDEKKYDKLILNILEHSDYLILYAYANRNNQRLFLLNAWEPFCVEKYFGQWCKPAGE